MDVVKGPDSDMERTLKRMVDEYQLPLLRLCWLYLHDRQLAEDAVQETFIKAARSLHSFRGESSEKTWLTRIAIRTCCDMRRSAWLRHIDSRVTPDMLPEAAHPQQPEDLELSLAVMNLPDKLKEAIILYYYHDMSTQEIALALGISQPTVSNRLKRAREKLKKQLERRGTNE